MIALQVPLTVVHASRAPSLPQGGAFLSNRESPVLKPLKDFWSRLSVAPFEALVAVWAAYAGAAGLLHVGVTTDILAGLLPGWVVIIFNLGYICAGVAMFFGIGLGRRELEGFGLLTVMGSILIRQIATIYLLGLSSVIFNSIVLNALAIAACIVRLGAVTQGHIIIRIEPEDAGGS